METTSGAPETLELKDSASTSPSDRESSSDVPNASKSVRYAANASLSVNMLLFLIKIVVFWLTLSVSIIASLVDSTLDLLSQLIMFFAERNMGIVHEKYPVGKTRLEPIAILSVSIIMVMSAVLVIRESIGILLTGYANVSFTIVTIIIMSLVILLKFLLWVYCRQFTYSPIAMALSEDHLNDVLSNGVALIAGSLASGFVLNGILWWLDSTGAIVISLYIIYSWYGMGRNEMKKLVGRRANDEMLGEIKNICDKHDDNMIVDRIRAYHVGRNVLVEVEMVMPENTTLKVSHDKSMQLQVKIEKFDYVERAFVHVDYQPREYDEHKRPVLV